MGSNKTTRQLRKEHGLCIDCGMPSLNSASCWQCYLKRREQKRLLIAKRRENGLCQTCGKTPIEGKSYCEVCQARSRKNYQQHRQVRVTQVRTRTAEIKDLVLGRYGRCCVVCGEARPPCLELHHKNNDGTEHRKALGLGVRTSGVKFYRRLLEGPYVDNLEVLCANCHAVRHYKGSLA